MARRRKQGMIVAVVFLLAVCALLFVAAALGGQPAPWARAITMLAQWLGLLLLAALVLYLARRRLLAWARERLIDVAGPALVRSMSPRAVLTALLPSIYGVREPYQEVITAVLGGAGRELSGTDTTVSRNTTAHIRLQSIGGTACTGEISWSHEISGMRNNHRYVIFATCDRDLYALVNQERVFPLFEAWKLDNDDQLEDFIPTLRASLQIGVTYMDMDGCMHVAEPRRQEGVEVALRDFDQYVRIPSGMDRKDLRILQFDLYDLADPDHVVESVEQVSIRAAHVFPAELAYLSWSSPHPCFVRRITFDVADLPLEGEELLYFVTLATLNRGIVHQRWRGAGGRIEVAVDSWMLPGHGVALAWRPIDGAEPRRAAE